MNRLDPAEQASGSAKLHAAQPAGARLKKITFWCALAVVVVMSLLPGALLPTAFSFWDKAQHALGFFGLTVLALWAYPTIRLQHIGMGLLVAGGAIELTQSVTGWRYGDWLDMLANAVGITAALGAGRLVQRLSASGVT